MGETDRCREGDWVEVERVLLDPADRSANLPEDTAGQPLLMWVKGFAQAEAAVGDQVAVESMTGRVVTGTLSAVNPGYFHTFGQPIPELVHVGADLRARLAAWRAADGRPAVDGGQAAHGDSAADGAGAAGDSRG